MTARILVIDPDATNLALFQDILRTEGYAVTGLCKPPLWADLAGQPSDVLVVDVAAASDRGYWAWLDHLLHMRRLARFAGRGTVPVGCRGWVSWSVPARLPPCGSRWRGSAQDFGFVAKPFDLDDLLAAIQAQLETRRVTVDAISLPLSSAAISYLFE